MELIQKPRPKYFLAGIVSLIASGILLWSAWWILTEGIKNPPNYASMYVTIGLYVFVIIILLLMFGFGLLFIISCKKLFQDVYVKARINGQDLEIKTLFKQYKWKINDIKKILKEYEKGTNLVDISIVNKNTDYQDIKEQNKDKAESFINELKTINNRITIKEGEFNEEEYYKD